MRVIERFASRPSAIAPKRGAVVGDVVMAGDGGVRLTCWGRELTARGTIAFDSPVTNVCGSATGGLIVASDGGTIVDGELTQRPLTSAPQPVADGWSQYAFSPAERCWYLSNSKSLVQLDCTTEVPTWREEFLGADWFGGPATITILEHGVYVDVPMAKRCGIATVVGKEFEWTPLRFDGRFCGVLADKAHYVVADMDEVLRVKAIRDGTVVRELPGESLDLALYHPETFGTLQRFGKWSVDNFEEMSELKYEASGSETGVFWIRAAPWGMLVSGHMDGRIRAFEVVK